jgi:hypothetical protein
VRRGRSSQGEDIVQHICEKAIGAEMLWFILVLLVITGFTGFFGSHTLVSGGIQIFVICALVALGIKRIWRIKDEY